jgi:hypothetical protein
MFLCPTSPATSIGAELIIESELSNLRRRVAAAPSTDRTNTMNTRRHLTVRRRPRVCLVATAALFVIAAGVAARAADREIRSGARIRRPGRNDLRGCSPPIPGPGQFWNA